MTIQQRLKDAVSSIVASQEEVEVLGNRPMDRSSLDDKKVYLQIAAVTPFFEPEELPRRKTPFERNFAISSSLLSIRLMALGFFFS